MLANIKRLILVGAVATVGFGALPASAHERLDARDEPAASKLDNLILYADARLAFYGSEAPGAGCRERTSEKDRKSTARAEE